jgi:hypothetical protein
MALYTFILEYAGGTYIKQARARSLVSASKKYYIQLEHDDGIPLHLKIVSKLRGEEAAGHKPVALDGLTGVWCTGMTLRRQFLLLNIVICND